MLPVPFLRNVGASGFVPVVSLAVAVTLLPVVLAAAGPRLDWPRLRREARHSRTWAARAGFVVRHGAAAAAAGAAVLAALLLPLPTIRLGEPPTSSHAQAGPAHATLSLLTRGGLPAGIQAPSRTSPARAPQTASVSHIPGIAIVVAPATAAYRAGTQSPFPASPSKARPRSRGQRLRSHARHHERAHSPAGVNGTVPVLPPTRGCPGQTRSALGQLGPAEGVRTCRT